MSIVPHPLPIVDGKIYKTKKNKNKFLSDEEAAMKELEAILAVKNRKHCDCEAQEHKLVSNCLNCGRIVCDFEGPGNCLNCGNLVLNRDQRSRLQEHINLIPATLNLHSPSHKTSKSHRVIDDQFNYFSMADQKWLTEKDRQTLRQEMDDLQATKYQRKLMLNVDIDNMTGGAESVPCIEDFEKRVRDLQITSEQLPGGSSVTKQSLLLRDIVASEANKIFQFKYLTEAERDESKKVHQNQVKAKNARSAKSCKSKQPKKDVVKDPVNKEPSSSKQKSTSSGTKNMNSTKKNQNEKIITQTRSTSSWKNPQSKQQSNPAPRVKNAWKENTNIKDQIHKGNPSDKMNK